METRLRLASGQDAPLVYRLMDDYYNEAHCVAQPKKHRWAIEKLVDNPAVGRLWILQVGQDVVGYIVLSLGYSLERGGMDAYIDDLYVIPAARRRGFGRTALQLALGEAAQLGAQAVHLQVDRANDRARHMCRQLGFADRDQHPLMTFRLVAEEPESP